MDENRDTKGCSDCSRAVLRTPHPVAPATPAKKDGKRPLFTNFTLETNKNATKTRQNGGQTPQPRTYRFEVEVPLLCLVPDSSSRGRGASIVAMKLVRCVPGPVCPVQGWDGVSTGPCSRHRGRRCPAAPCRRRRSRRCLCRGAWPFLRPCGCLRRLCGRLSAARKTESQFRATEEPKPAADRCSKAPQHHSTHSR